MNRLDWTDVLGEEAPAGIAALDGDLQIALATLLAESQQRQRSQLEAALEAALGHVPRVLRGAVRRVLFP